VLLACRIDLNTSHKNLSNGDNQKISFSKLSKAVTALFIHAEMLVGNLLCISNQLFVKLCLGRL